MGIIRKKIIDNSFFVFITSMATILMCVYISEASSNVPIMDYWRFLDVLVEKSYMGGCSFSDIYNVNGVHRSIIQPLLYLMNVKFFHWNTQISMYMAAILCGINVAMLYKITKAWMTNVSVLVPIIFVLYSLVPYEIISQEFAFSFELRLFFYIHFCKTVSVYLSDNTKNNEKKSWIICLYYIFIVDAIGGAYSIAFGFSVAIVIIGDSILKSVEKNIIKNRLIILSGYLTGIALYLCGLTINTFSSEVMSRMPITEYFKGIFILFGTSVVGTYSSRVSIIVCGVALVIMHIIFLGIYIRNELYRDSYIPAIFYIYSVGFCVLLLCGRVGVDIWYLSSSRYSIDSSFAIMADIIVISMIESKSSDASIKRRIFVSLFFIYICAGITIADIKETQIAPYRKEYDENLITIMNDIDNYTDDELTVFQADSAEQVRRGIDTMKKYKLGIYNL